MLDDIASGGFWTGAAQFATADNGTLVYVPGSNTALPVHWRDAGGTTTALRPAIADWSDPTFAPDGRHLAMNISDAKQSDIWLYDWTRNAMSRLTLDSASDLKPVWSPDGTRIAFASSRGQTGALEIYWQRADGTGNVQRLTESAYPKAPTSWHPSGKFLAFIEADPKTSFDVMILPVEGDERSGWKPGSPTAFVNTAAVELEPMFSPDGRWLAYFSNKSGQPEVYVRPFPGPGRVWQVSSDGGSFPTWSMTRSELLYSTRDQRIMVVPFIVEGGSFRAASPRLWTDARHQLLGPLLTRSFALHPDGKRVAFAIVPEPAASKADQVVIAFNFFEELRRLVPAAR